jgi:histidinol-phosphate phosphatase family protein
MAYAVFLDRDGTINELSEKYVRDWSEFKFLDNSLEALRLLSKTDYKIIVLTNQSAVGRSRISVETLDDIHSKMVAEIEAVGGRIDGIYSCIHRPGEGYNLIICL